MNKSNSHKQYYLFIRPHLHRSSQQDAQYLIFLGGFLVLARFDPYPDGLSTLSVGICSQGVSTALPSSLPSPTPLTTPGTGVRLDGRQREQSNRSKNNQACLLGSLTAQVLQHIHRVLMFLLCLYLYIFILECLVHFSLRRQHVLRINRDYSIYFSQLKMQ